MAVAAVGTKFLIGTTTSTTSVGELTSIGGVSLSADTIESTALDTSGGYRTFVQGFKDGGEVSLEGYFNGTTASNQKTLYTDFQNGTVGTYSIVFPTALSASWQFNGVVTAFETSAETEGNVTFSATVKVSGAPTLS